MEASQLYESSTASYNSTVYLDYARSQPIIAVMEGTVRVPEVDRHSTPYSDDHFS